MSKTPGGKHQARLFTSFRDRLLADLDQIDVDLQVLLDASKIRNVDPNRGGSGGVAFIGFAKWGWVPSDEEQLRRRRELSVAYDRWWQRFATLFSGIQRETTKSVDMADKHLRLWINRERGDTKIPSSIREAKLIAAAWVSDLRAALDLLAAGGYDGIIVVPDTNALMKSPDFSRYGEPVGADSLRIVVPTKVLSELDDLKDRGRTDEVRNGAMAVVTRIKGLRDRGDITVGAPVTRDISLAVETSEPSFAELPAHLDPLVPDDRILASALNIQARFPAAVVVLMARDINIQTKAQVLGLPFVEPPA